MKKLIALVLTPVLCLSLCACGMSADAKAASAAIGKIGTVTLDSGDAIAEAETLFSDLSDEEKESVKNKDALTQAVEAYDKLLADAATPFLEMIVDFSDNIQSFNIAKCLELLDSLGTQFDAAHPLIRERMMSESLSGEGTLPESIEQWRETIAKICINDTKLAQPAYVLDYANKGAWLVNDHGDFAAYNLWISNSSQLGIAYEDYKAYAAAQVDITDNGDSFTFTDESGDTVAVLTHPSSETATLQVRVPRF